MSDHEHTVVNKGKGLEQEGHRAELRVVSDRISGSYSAVLKKAREKKGLSEKEVADALHVSSYIIKALENQHYESLPADTYVKGYIRSYAALLNLNPEGLIKDFLQDKQFRALSAQQRQLKEQEAQEKARLEKEPVFDQKIHQLADQLIAIKARYGTYIVIGVILFVAGVLIFYQSLSSVELQHKTQWIERVKVQGADGSIVVSEFSDAQIHTSMVNAVSDSAAITEDHIRMVFSDTSWVSIRDADNKLLHQSKETKGEVFQFTGKAPFYLRLSNARAAHVSFNGKEIDFTSALTDDGQLHSFELKN